MIRDATEHNRNIDSYQTDQLENNNFPSKMTNIIKNEQLTNSVVMAKYESFGKKDLKKKQIKNNKARDFEKLNQVDKLFALNEQSHNIRDFLQGCQINKKNKHKLKEHSKGELDEKVILNKPQCMIVNFFFDFIIIEILL